MRKAASFRDVHAALSGLRSLHDGDRSVADVVACGDVAVPELKEILFSREPSGIYETRRHAVEALAGLRALDVLRDFLSTPRDIADPVERAGEDAVINAAVRALTRVQDVRDLPLLFALLRARPLAGVIESLGRLHQPAALPAFIHALEDDSLRSSAEEAISRLGSTATRTLIRATLDRDPPIGHEAPSSIARRRSVLRILESLPAASAMVPPAFFRLVDEGDPWIALRAVRLCLPRLPQRQAGHAVVGLIAHLKTPDDLLAREIEDILVDHYPQAAAIAEAQRQCLSTVPVWRTTDRTRQTLARVRMRIDKTVKDALHG